MREKVSKKRRNDEKERKRKKEMDRIGAKNMRERERGREELYCCVPPSGVDERKVGRKGTRQEGDKAGLGDAAGAVGLYISQAWSFLLVIKGSDL